jgi:hypothetical protein
MKKICRRGHEYDAPSKVGCPICYKETKKRYYEANKEESNRRNREWIKANKTRYLKNAKRYRRTNKEKVKESYATWSANKPLYGIWRGMNKRCYDPKCDHYCLYGGRGITVCERWRGEEGYGNFIKDMPPRPSPKHSIDRINTNGNYEPTNCKWSTAAEQMRNRRNNVLVTINGETKCLKDWSLSSGINAKTLQKRIWSNWPEDQLLSPPNQKFHTRGSSKK